MVRLTLIPFLAIFHWACELPFATKSTDQENLFTVIHDYDGRRIVHDTPVVIQWSDVTIENFKEFMIERAYINEDGPQWALIDRVSDSLATSYTDTIDDDVTYQYRVRVVDKNNQYRHAPSQPFIVPQVTAITVPDDYTSIQKVYETKFIDSGDMISVKPGKYSGHFTFLDKDVSIIGTDGPSSTELEGSAGIQSVVEINRGRLEGLKITNGTAFWGGGIYAHGSAQISNCNIFRNRAVENPDAHQSVYPFGIGGGVFATDSAVIENCTIKWNSAIRSGGGINVEKMATIVNCNISINNSLIGGGLRIHEDYTGSFRNNRIDNNRCYNGEGAGIYVTGGQHQIFNCSISRNHSETGTGGIIIDAGSGLSIVNCVVYRNSTFFGNVGPILANGDIQIVNSIIWANTGTMDKKLIAGNSLYSDIQNIIPLSIYGNIDLAPDFEDPEAGDFHLRPGSPCIDAGSPKEASRDADGSRNDMGIYGGPYGE